MILRIVSPDAPPRDVEPPDDVRDLSGPERAVLAAFRAAGMRPEEAVRMLLNPPLPMSRRG